MDDRRDAVYPDWEEEHNPSGYKPKVQYKSAIWPVNEAQEEAARASKKAIEEKYGNVHTDISPSKAWHDAEEYHQVGFEGTASVETACRR